MTMMSLNRIHIPVVSDSRGSLAFIEQGGGAVCAVVGMACLRTVAFRRLRGGSGSARLCHCGRQPDHRRSVGGCAFSDGCDIVVSSGGVALVVGADVSGHRCAVCHEACLLYLECSVGSFAWRSCPPAPALLLMAASGSFDLTTDDGSGSLLTRRLDVSSGAVAVDASQWRVIERCSADAVVLAVASTPYDPTDYLYDYEQFIEVQRGAVAPLSVS